MSNPHYSVGELSDLLRVSQKWCYQQLNKGNIPGAFRLGSIWYIDREIFHASLKELALKPQRLPAKEMGDRKSRHNLI